MCKDVFKYIQLLCWSVIQNWPIREATCALGNSNFKRQLLYIRQDTGPSMICCAVSNTMAVWGYHHSFIPCRYDVPRGHQTWGVLWHFSSHNSVNFAWKHTQFVAMAFKWPQLHKDKWRTYSWVGRISDHFDTSLRGNHGLKSLNRSNSRFQLGEKNSSPFEKDDDSYIECIHDAPGAF